MYEVTIALDFYNIPRFNAKLSDKIKTLLALLERDIVNNLIFNLFTDYTKLIFQ